VRATGKGGKVLARDVKAAQALAEQWLEEQSGKLAAGEPMDAEPTLRAWTTQHYAAKVKAGKLSEATRSQHEAALRRHLAPFLDLPLNRITAAALERHYVARADAGAGPRALALALATLRCPVLGERPAQASGARQRRP